MSSRPDADDLLRAAGRARPSYIGTHSAGKDLTHAEQRTLQWGATLLFNSANDTQSGSMTTFVLCMLLNPAVQRRVHAELDALVGTGPDRLPALTDRESLPYLEACIWETLRWYPVAPEGMVHMARVDSIHEGCLIPKGTLLIPNVWLVALICHILVLHSAFPRAFAHDPNTYADPFEFRPERFLGPTPEPLPDFVYGFGRRACPGQLLAQCTMFTFAANLLAVCSIEHAKGPDGQDIEVKPEFTGVVTMYALIPPMPSTKINFGFFFSAPKPFPCVIKPRSERAKALLEAALASADA
jgi:cytochrome P450